MTIGWVAASTRGRSLAARLVGLDGAGVLARSVSWDQARKVLATTPYGSTLDPLADRAGAHDAVASTASWYLRVLAGWLPANGAGLARSMAGPLEIANIERHLSRLAGVDASLPVELGSLAVGWRRVAAATTVEQVRAALGRSTWGDPEVDDASAIVTSLWLSWLRRLARQVDDFGDAARGAAAVIVARETLTFGRALGDRAGERADLLLGPSWRKADTLPDLRRRLPASAAWALDGLASSGDVWRAEVAVVERFAITAQRLVVGTGNDRATVAAVMVLVLIDRWRVDAAIEVAGRRPSGVFDDVA